MGLLLGIPVAVFTWLLVVEIPYLILSPIFGAYSHVTQGVASLCVLFIGPIAGIAAFIACSKIDFSSIKHANRAKSASTSPLRPAFVIIRFPFYLITLILWILFALPATFFCIIILYFFVILLNIAWIITWPFIILYAALIDEDVIEAQKLNRRNTTSEITKRIERLWNSLYLSPKNLSIWLIK